MTEEKQYAGRFNDDFIETRRGDLERWINRIVRHPLARGTEVVMFFLGCESDLEYAKRLPTFLAAYPTPGPSFYSHVFHPQFNVDVEDAAETGARFRKFVERGTLKIGELRTAFGIVREVGKGEINIASSFDDPLMVPWDRRRDFLQGIVVLAAISAFDISASRPGLATHKGCIVRIDQHRHPEHRRLGSAKWCMVLA